MTWDLVRFTLSILGAPTSDLVVASGFLTVRACREAIHRLPAAEKRPGVRYECRPVPGGRSADANGAP